MLQPSDTRTAALGPAQYAAKLSKVWGPRLLLLLLSTGVSVYAMDLILAFFTEKEEVRMARAFGVDFDARSSLEVIHDLKEQHISAVPDVFPRSLLERQADGVTKSKIIIDGTEVLPLGGPSNTTTVFCNEGGQYVIFESDERGFHNPKGIWDAGRVEVAALGDSFVEGSCVPSDQNLVALIRRRHPLTLNLGKRGNGPLIEIAVLKEYLPSLEPKVVLWFYFEGNDSRDLERERDAPLLMSYLSDSFTQGLLNRQTDIDRVLVTSIERWSKSEIRRRRLDAITAVLKLNHLKSRLGLETEEVGDDQAGVQELDLDLFGRILTQAQTLVSTWGGVLYFIYLPEVARYASPEIANKDRDRVLALVRAMRIPIVDIHSVFQGHKEPLALFPFRHKIHYNEEGHRLVAEEVMRSVSFSDL